MTTARSKNDAPGAAGRLLAAALLALLTFGDGAAALEVLLRAPNYVFAGESAVFACDHGVGAAQLHKVEWLKDGDHKLFQFVRGRNPPFRNFTIPGAMLDWSRSNEHEIRLTNMSLESSGVYSCEVSMETPIYTKPSNDERLVVIQRQSAEPVVSGVKSSYFAGEKVAVNCTSSPSHPPVQIAWLVNGREVSEQLLTRFPEEGATRRQYELTSSAHRPRPFRTGSEEEHHPQDTDDHHESHPLQGNALGSVKVAQARGKSDFLASAALGNLYGTTTTASPRGGRGKSPTNSTTSAPAHGASSTLAPGGLGSTSATDEDGEEESIHMDAYDPPEVVPVVTATATSTTVQLSFVLTDEVVRYLKKDSEESGNIDVDPSAPKVRLILTCSAIIPETVDGKYADERQTTIAADVILSEETAARFSSASHSTHVPPGACILLLPLLASLFLLTALQPRQKIPTTRSPSTRGSSQLFQLSLLTRAVYSTDHTQPRR
ncbi:uncharacterized protein LOC124157144 [Ischnura elegans]|uniref:uncharacterized protein LOC124157144 n=1 Tax=Ischnura elegans TaxID=197161 RepID=UPI001ED8A2BB|nr:uncharacterized protein LOC124157144 [Ischnura elegans]